MERTCRKCGFTNTDASPTSEASCPKCSAIYSKVEASIAAKLPQAPDGQPSEARSEPQSRSRPWLPWIVHLGIPSATLAIWAQIGPHLSRAARDYNWPIVAGCCCWITLFLIYQWGKLKERDHKAHVQHLEDVLKRQGYSLSDAIRGWQDQRMIVIDQIKQQIALFAPVNPMWCRLVPFSNLLSAELHEDGQTVSTTSGGASIGRAVMGRALFGVAGEVIGGTTGKRVTTSKELASGIELRLVIKDVKDPTWDLPFLVGELPKASAEYRAIAAYARKVAGSLAAAIAIAKDAGGSGENVSV